MTEEYVTKNILKKLKKLGFKILSFDYPQSGTGVLLDSQKTDFPSLNIDIIATKNKEIWFFENKNRYYSKDFYKLEFFKNNYGEYKESFYKKFNIDLEKVEIKTFIGLPKEQIIKVKKDKREIVDELWGVE